MGNRNPAEEPELIQKRIERSDAIKFNGTSLPSAQIVSGDASTRNGVAGLLVDIFDRLMGRAEEYVSGRFWIFEVLLLAVLFSVLFSGGIDRRLWDLNDTYPDGYFEKIAHPLADVGRQYSSPEHDAKLNFRLTVPVVLHLLGVPREERWVLPVLTAGAICCLLLFSCLFVYRVTRDRVCGLLLTLAGVSTYIGSFAFTRYYDAIAIAQLTLAMLPGLHPALKGLLVFTAAFTDERALLASSLLLAQSLCCAGQRETVGKHPMSRDFMGVLCGMIAYVPARMALAEFAGLSSPLGGVGMQVFLTNSPFWHAGVWFALKGGWLLVVLAFLSLWHRRHITGLAVFSLAVFATVAGGFIVLDVLRSTSYVYPGLLVAVAVLSETDSTRLLRAYCLMAFLISAVAGNYNVWMGQVTWFQPLAAKFIEHVLRAVFPSG